MSLADALLACEPPLDAVTTDVVTPDVDARRASLTARVASAFETIRASKSTLERARRERNDNDARASSALIVEVGTHAATRSPSTAALVVLACGAHGGVEGDDGPAWSSRDARDAAARTFDAVFANDPDGFVEAFVESCEKVLFDALRVPRDSFAAEASELESRARVAARRLLWGAGAAADAARTADVLAVAMPCALRAMDYPCGAVKVMGARAAAIMQRTGRLAERGRADALLDAARAALAGALPEVWPHALEMACALTVETCVANDRDAVEEYRKTFARAIDCASLHGADVAYARPFLRVMPAFVESARACVVVHLNRLLPLLCGYMRSVRDDVAVDAARLVAVVARNAWPRMRAHCRELWPHLKCAYAEADARSAKSCDALRREIERVAELVQLAAGDSFADAWKNDSDVPERAVGLVRFVASLPERVVG